MSVVNDSFDVSINNSVIYMQNLRRITSELKRLEEEEKENKSQQLEMAKQRQRAIDDLDKGVSIF